MKILEIYNEINGELAKRLSVRRHEELERRRKYYFNLIQKQYKKFSFYNVENEIFEEHKEGGVQDEENDSGEEVEKNDSATTEFDGSPKMKRQKFDYLEEKQINQDKDEIHKVDENKQQETNDEDADIDNSIDEEEEVEELNQEDEENKESDECYDDEEQESDHSLEKAIVKKRRIIEDDDDEEKMEEKIEGQEVCNEQQNFIAENDLFTCEDEVDGITENLESFIDQEAEISDLDEMDENEEDISLLTPTPQNRLENALYLKDT